MGNPLIRLVALVFLMAPLVACSDPAQEPESKDTAPAAVTETPTVLTPTPETPDDPVADATDTVENAGEEPEPKAPAFSIEALLPREKPEDLVDTVVRTTIVRGLDKVTARIKEIELPQDQVVRFGTLEVTARYCRSRPPEEQPETFAYLEIEDIRDDGTREPVFSGWMLASSPALNAVEHPVYVVWVIACKTSEPETLLPNE